MTKQQTGYLAHIWEFLQDKILLGLGAFVALAIGFSILSNLFHSFSIRGEIAHLEEEKEYFQEEVSRDSALLENLKSDYELEKYAREKYHMRRTDEDIYIIK